MVEKQGMNSGYNPNCKEALSDSEVLALDLITMPKALKIAYKKNKDIINLAG